MKEQRSGMPVFVKVDNYKEIVDVLDLIKHKIEDVRSTISNLNDMRKEEDSEIQMWHGKLSEIERKIEGIDKIMFEPEHNW